MRRMRFLSKAITICSRKKIKFNCKNNHRYSKLVNFSLDIINKINCKMLVVILYILLPGLQLEKVQLV